MTAKRKTKLKPVKASSMLLSEPGIEQYMLVYVFWDDIVENNAWTKHADVKAAKPSPCVNTGFLVSLTEESIIIANSICDVNKPNGDKSYTVIPYGCVKEIVQA